MNTWNQSDIDQAIARQPRKRPAACPVQPWRLFLVAACLLLCVAVIGWKVAALHIQQRDFLQGQGDARTIRSLPLAANRGLITDRNGEPLAMSSPVRSIWVNPRLLLQAPAAIARLAEALQLNPKTLHTHIADNTAREFLYVRRHLPPAVAERVLALGVKGVYAQQEYRRFYPQGEATAHLVGVSNIDDVGQEGMELAYNHRLQGVPGRRQVMKNARGHIIQELGVIRPAQPGGHLQLSIDLRIQNLAYRELKTEYITRQAKSASIVVLDVDTGEVLAMANQPSYNPHNKSSIPDFSVLRNRAVTDVFEPGSTIKPFTIAAALESGLYSPDTRIETAPGRMTIGPHDIRDIRDYGTLTLTQVMTRSSNVASSKIALEVGPEPLRDMLERVGFGRDSGSGFPGERHGVLPGQLRWRDIETATLSFGYGLSATALQMAQAYSVLADGGVRKPVSLLKLDHQAVAALWREQVVSPAVTAQVMDMMETVVDPSRGGSADEAEVHLYRVAGKTGTAHVVGAYGYEDNRYNSLFAGVVPARDPKIVVVVIINEPRGGEHFGGQVAAPVFARVAGGAMRILNIPPTLSAGDEAPARITRSLDEGNEDILEPATRMSALTP